MGKVARSRASDRAALPAQSAPGMKHLQIQIFPQICCSNMLVLGFRPAQYQAGDSIFILK